MKKIYFAIAACAMFAFAACNNSTGTENKDSMPDTTAAPMPEPTPAPADTTHQMDSSAKKTDAPAAGKH